MNRVCLICGDIADRTAERPCAICAAHVRHSRPVEEGATRRYATEAEIEVEAARYRRPTR